VPDRCFNVLFLCTGNSARSIIAEAILNNIGIGHFRAWNAGSHPKGQVHPETIRLLNNLGHETTKLRSKSWTEFSDFGAPPLDFVVTVCDSAEGEICPVWPGQPTTAHWGIPDPAEAEGSPTEITLAFHHAYQMLHRCLSLFAGLPVASLDKFTLQAKLREIGRMADAAEPNR
jgi:arsenate reductase (thioredoxin)